jgi:hypothetical protein
LQTSYRAKGNLHWLVILRIHLASIHYAMTQKVPCSACQVPILPATASSNNGLCWPCKRGTRQQFDKAKQEAKEERVRAAERLKEDQLRHNAILKRLSELSDAQVIAELEGTPPIADEDDPVWREGSYWHTTAELYIALSDVCAKRRLEPAVSMLLQRACYGDPGEIMRGLRHRLEAIVTPNWDRLADICLDLAESSRPGTRLWTIWQLAILEDARARSVFERAIDTDQSLISDAAKAGLERLELVGIDTLSAPVLAP